MVELVRCGETIASVKFLKEIPTTTKVDSVPISTE